MASATKTKEKRYSVTSLLEKVVTYMGVASSGFIMIILFAMTGEVISRALFNRPFEGTVEASGLLLVVTFYLGIAYLHLTNRNIKLDLLQSRYSAWQKSLLSMLTSIIILILFLLIGYFGATMTITSYQRKEFVFTLPYIPLWTIRLMVPIGSLMLALVAVKDLVQQIRNFPHLTSKKPEESTTQQI